MRALFYVDGAVILFPQPDEVFFPFGKGNADPAFGGNDGAFPDVAERRFRAPHVVDDEGLRRESLHEVRQDEGEDVVVRFERAIKDAAFSLHEPQKAREVVRFARHLAYVLPRGEHGGVREHIAHGAAFAHDEPEVREGDLLALRASAPQEQGELVQAARVAGAQLCLYPRAFFRIRGRFDDACVQSELYVFLRSDRAPRVRAGIKCRRVESFFRSVGEIYVHNCPVCALAPISGREKRESCSYFSSRACKESRLRTSPSRSEP